jgi:hypothetical protein
MHEKQYAARITFTEAILGSAPLDEEVYTTYIASKAPAGLNGTAQSELELMEEADIKGRTGFLRTEAGQPLLMNYTYKGFMKEAWQACRQIPGSHSAALKNGKSKINTLIFVEPRHIILRLPTGGVESINERPLRAETARGPRVALAASEMLPKGTWCDVRFVVLAPQVITEDLLREWLDYGRFLGMGQWRGGAFGTFSHNLKVHTPA